MAVSAAGWHGPRRREAGRAAWAWSWPLRRHAAAPRARNPGVVPADHVVLALPFTTLRHVERSSSCAPGSAGAASSSGSATSRSAATRRCSFSSMSGSGTKAGGRPATPTARASYRGAWDATGYQLRQDRDPGRAARGRDRDRLGIALPAARLSRPRPRPDGRGLPDRVQPAVPRRSRAAYNGRSFYVWSAGDPHIRGAYSYLRVGQYTGLQRRPGASAEGNVHFAGEHTSVESTRATSRAPCAVGIAAPTRSPACPRAANADGCR